MRLACMRLVLAPFILAPLALSSGCYLSHGLGDDPDGGRRDAPGLDAAAVDTAVAPGAPRCSLVLDAELLVASEEEGNLYAPDIFWTGERIGVVMSEDNAGGFEHGIVSMGHVDRALTEAAPRRLVGEESHGWGEAAWNGEGFGVCWSGDPGGVSATRFREVGGLDGALGPVTSFGTGNESCLDLVFGHGRYAISWRRVYREEGAETMVDALVQVMERDGILVGEPINMGTSPYGGYSPGLEATREGFVAVANNEDSVRVVRFDRNGRTTRDDVVPIPGADYTAFALREGRLALATLSGVRETRTLTFRILDEALRVQTTRVIVDGAPNASRPRILARPEGWMLVWGEGSRPSYRAMMLSLDENARPLAPRQVLYDGLHSGYGGPSLLDVDGDAYVGISHQLPSTPDYSREYTHVQRWTCSGEAEDLCRPQDAQAESSADCSRSVLLGWRFDGERCVSIYDCDSGCRGEDCGRLATSRFECESDRAECLVTSCSDSESPAVGVCGPTQVRSGEPAWLDVSHGAEDDPCVCERPTCHVVPSGPLELTVALDYCAAEVPDCDCDFDPVRPSVPCALPPLAPGTWTLRFADRDPVSVESTRGPIEGAVLCR